MNPVRNFSPPKLDSWLTLAGRYLDRLKDLWFTAFFFINTCKMSRHLTRLHVRHFGAILPKTAISENGGKFCYPRTSGLLYATKI